MGRTVVIGVGTAEVEIVGIFASVERLGRLGCWPCRRSIGSIFLPLGSPHLYA